LVTSEERFNPGRGVLDSVGLAFELDEVAQLGHGVEGQRHAV
jgi:hypothetical protein